METLVRRLFLIICLCAMSIIGNAQTIIQMEEYGGVYRIPCKVNGAKMKLIFDTGADKVCLSLSMAEYLMDNDYLSINDIKGSGSSTVADGSLVDHIKINIKDIEIQGIHLKDVEAVVIDGQNAPLLLGQSAIKKLGTYSISGNNLIIDINSTSRDSETVILSKTETDQLIKEADNAYDDDAIYVAAEKYRLLLMNGKLDSPRKIKYARCLNRLGNVDDALTLCLSIQSDIEKRFPNEKAELYYQIGILYGRKKETDLSLTFIEKAKFYAEPWSELQYTALTVQTLTYYMEDRFPDAVLMLEDYINKYLKYRGWKPTDCWEKSLTDEMLGRLYRDLARLYYFDDEKYYVISAAWGNEDSIEECEERNLNYSSKKCMYKYSY